jgi:hypothetical protein
MKNSFETSPLAGQNTIEKMSFPKTESFLASKARTLTNEYKDENGHLEHCGLLAIDVARLILEEGGHPSLYAIRGQIIDSDGNRKTLTPKQYNGKITWGGHTVCENQGIIYDPMVGRAVPLSQYLEETFTEPVTSKIDVPSDKIQDFIDKK